MAQIENLKTGHKFKKTEAGEIPVEWEVARLGDAAQINMGQSPPSSNCFDYENGLPFFQGKAEFGTKYPKIMKWCSSPTKIAEKGDILISVRAPVGDVNIAPEKCCIGRGLAAIRGNKTYHDFLYFIMNFFKDTLAKTGQGSTFEAINKDVLLELKIPLPTLPEQKKIAEILLTVDSAIEKTAQLIEKKKELKKGLMQDLLTHGIGHKKFKKTKIGEIPIEWEVTRIVEIVQKIIDNRGKTPPLSSEGYELIEVNAIEADRKYPNYGKVEKYVNEQTYAGWFRDGHPEKEDILIPTVGTVGVTAIMNENRGCIAQNIIAVRLNSQMHPTYFYYYTKSKFFLNQINQVVMSAVQPSLKVPHFLRFLIQIPSLPEQKKIAEILSSVDAEIEQEVSEKERIEQLKKGLMQVLLTGKVRVRI